MRGLGAYFPDGSYGESIFLMNEGEIVLPSFMSSDPVLGMHGYHPDAQHSYTTLVTNATEQPYPQDLLELHALLRREILEAAS